YRCSAGAAPTARALDSRPIAKKPPCERSCETRAITRPGCGTVCRSRYERLLLGTGHFVYQVHSALFSVRGCVLHNFYFERRLDRDVDMDRVGSDVERNLASLDGLPLAQMAAMYENETVLANSVQRVLDAARSDPRDTVAAFNNYV